MPPAMTRNPSLVLALLGLGLGACGGDLPADDVDPEDLAPPVADGKTEVWDRANNPAFVDGTFLMHVSQLPLRGEGPRPIPSDYWPVYKDSLNVRWNGEMSPAEKYARAFGKDVEDVQEAVSRANGIKGQAGRRACETDADCADLDDGSSCGASYDGEMKRCVPTWFGICHGWAPYAYREPQARHPVVRNAPDGTPITFYPSDLEALMSLLYTDIDSKFLSSRCELGGGGTTVATDNAGRVISAPCLDMNPGTWHVLATNRLGLRREGFVLDQTLNFEVWNQPMWKYEIVNGVEGGLREVTRAEATALVGGGGDDYRWNTNARRFYHVEMDATFVVESQPGREPRDAADFAVTKRYEYVLEADDNGKIFGGEWVGKSKTDHPDFAWWATSAPTSDVAGIRYDDVRGLNDEASGATPAARETLFEGVLPHTFFTRSTYRTLQVPAGYRRVSLVMNGTGEARLMVGPKGKEPRLVFGDNLCDSNVSNTANQACSFEVDPAGGAYHIRMRSEEKGTRVTLVASKIE
jgi:hypothetical protein